jgi:hypothetical protein
VQRIVSAQDQVLPAAISWMEALSWPRWLKTEHAKLVRARADGTPWKQICWRHRPRNGASAVAPAKWTKADNEAVASLCDRLYVVQRERTTTGQFTG